MLDKLAPPAEETARETTEAWIEAFGAAHSRGDERALSGLFAEDGHWRNRYIALQFNAIEQGRLSKRIETQN